jgi:hypothetical protein
MYVKLMQIIPYITIGFFPVIICVSCSPCWLLLIRETTMLASVFEREQANLNEVKNLNTALMMAVCGSVPAPFRRHFPVRNTVTFCKSHTVIATACL